MLVDSKVANGIPHSDCVSESAAMKSNAKGYKAPTHGGNDHSKGRDSLISEGMQNLQINAIDSFMDFIGIIFRFCVFQVSQ